MENKRSSKKVFWFVLATLVAVIIGLALIIRTEKRLLRLVGKVEKALLLKKKNTPITVEI